MSKKPKLLWCGDIVAMTGFARVTENVLKHLDDKFEICVLGHNWWGDPTPLQDRYKMFPSSNRYQTEPFGVQRIREVVEREKPDIVFRINIIIELAIQFFNEPDSERAGPRRARSRAHCWYAVCQYSLSA